MSDQAFRSEWVRRYRCPWCRTVNGDPSKCKPTISEKHEGYKCQSYRSREDRRMRSEDFR